MDYLWTPWRYQYLVASGKPDGCVFCNAPQDPDDRRTLIVHRATYNYVILNRFPYTNGHLMVVPYRHVASLQDIEPEILTELILLAQTAERVLRAVYRPDGLNFGMNLGASAGAGIAGHLHLHGLPRWMGDANFMTVVGETRVLPEDLSVTWQRLRDAFHASGPDALASK